MQITAVDSEHNLFRVENAVPSALAQQVLATDWLSLPWTRQLGQENWLRRRIDETAISWIQQWHDYHNCVWADIGVHIDQDLSVYQGTAWWLDEPGFVCDLHTDGELPGSMQLTWHGARQNHGTAFYWHNNTEHLRQQFPCVPNTGYVMVNQADAMGYLKLLWHGMLEPVPLNSYRLTSYTWINPVK
jgi:hypothetical protein